MKFWVDLSTPKEVLFFRPIIEELKERGHKVVLTTRKYTETNDLLEFFDIKAEMIGSHGSTRVDKLSEGIERLRGLYERFKDEVIDGVITLVNPEVCRVAFGLGFPLFNFIDMIEADAVCKLTLPLSKGIFIPFHLPVNQLMNYWAGDKLYIYDCLDVCAWMPDQPQRMEVKYPLIVYRSAETEASYFSGYCDFTVPVIKELKKALPHVTFREIPRYKKHEIIDLRSLLYYANVFIGGGGTINQEACWWGTWSISCRPTLTSYDKWLIDNDIMYHSKTIKNAVKMAISMIGRGMKNTNAEKIRKQVFPLKSICDKLERWCVQ